VTPPERIGRFEIVSVLSTGGMGDVYLARLAGLGGFARHVVLKTIANADDESDAAAMFLDEARVLGHLHHHHIAPIYEIDRDDDQLFLVMDYIHGHTAHEVWQRTAQIGAALPIDFSLTVAAAAASGLHYAHTRRAPDGTPLHIVHRDVSLSNLMIGFDGGVKVIDFGIAKAANRSAQTQVGFVKGKLGYMAPEQLRGQTVDARTDVFALGIVLYELTTMKRAFREDTDRATAERVKTAAFTPPSEVVPGYPAELERIVRRALAAEPRERYPDADLLRRELEALGHRLELVLGDAAVSEIMVQLFDDHGEPWDPGARERAETDARTSLEVISRDDTKPSRFPNRRAGELSLRTATQTVDQLILDLETPVHGTPIVPGADSEPVPKIALQPDTDAITAIGAPPAPSRATPTIPGVAPPRMPIDRSARMPIAPRRSQRAGWIAAGVVGALAVAAMVTSFVDCSEPPVVAVAIDAPILVDAPPPIDAPPDAPPDAPLPIRIVIVTRPAGADVFLGDDKLGTTPLDTKVTGAGMGTLTIRRRGYREAKIEVSLDADVRRDDVKLRRQ
jgi:eukaryotic-like serine/threonine-protein kinase